MILADTSIWIDHLRQGDDTLAGLLNDFAVLCHPHVIGELACGCLHNRSGILHALQRLPRARVASEEEALRFIENQDLAAKGIGYIDVHLLAATILTPGARLWTRDRHLEARADSLGLRFAVP